VLGAAPASALAAESDEGVHAVIVGHQRDPATRALLDAAASAGRPDLLVTFYDLAVPSPPAVPASVRRLLGDARAQGRAVAYVCTETQCSLPITSPARLRRAILEFNPSP